MFFYVGAELPSKRRSGVSFQWLDSVLPQIPLDSNETFLLPRPALSVTTRTDRQRSPPSDPPSPRSVSGRCSGPQAPVEKNSIGAVSSLSHFQDTSEAQTDAALMSPHGTDRAGSDWTWDEVADSATEEDLSLFSDL